MVRIFKVTIAYWFRIFASALSSIWKFVRGNILLALILLIFSLVSFYLAGNKVVDVAIANGYLTDFASQARLIVAIILCAGFYLLLSLIYQPAKSDAEQRLTIKRQNSQINPQVHFDVSPIAQLMVPGDDWLIKIKIHNASGIRRIERCKVWLDQINDLPTQTPHYFADYRASLPFDLKWADMHNPDADFSITIERQGDAIIELARSSNDAHEGHFMVAHGYEIYYFPSGEYQLLFRIIGVIRASIDGKEILEDIEPQNYSATIKLAPTIGLSIDRLTLLPSTQSGGKI